MSRRYAPFPTGRRISRTARQRASTLDTAQIGPYLDQTIMLLGQSVDQWRFKSGPASEVALALDALMALWNEVELRGIE